MAVKTKSKKVLTRSKGKSVAATKGKTPGKVVKRASKEKKAVVKKVVPKITSIMRKLGLRGFLQAIVNKEVVLTRWPDVNVVMGLPRTDNQPVAPDLAVMWKAGKGLKNEEGQALLRELCENALKIKRVPKLKAVEFVPTMHSWREDEDWQVGGVNLYRSHEQDPNKLVAMPTSIALREFGVKL